MSSAVAGRRWTGRPTAGYRQREPELQQLGGHRHIDLLVREQFDVVDLHR
jgi:hypothetical protein